eukprot:766238-Hanusia_phi.AAC.1
MGDGDVQDQAHPMGAGEIDVLLNQERYETHNKKQITKANPPQNRTRGSASPIFVAAMEGEEEEGEEEPTGSNA